MKRSLALLTPLFWALLCSNAPAQEDSALVLIPQVIAQGGELRITIAGQEPDSDRQVTLRALPGGRPSVLADLVLDGTGADTFAVALEQTPPGDYLVELTDYSNVLASANLTITAALEIRLNPEVPISGAPTGVVVSNLRSGTVSLSVDGQPWVGPLQVQGSQYIATLPFPEGAQGSVLIEATEVMVTQVIAKGTLTAVRQAPSISSPQSISFNPPAEPLRPGGLFPISGVIRMPEGRSPQDATWSLVVRRSNGQNYPINTQPIRFTQIPGTSDYSYEGEMLMPSTATNFPLLPTEELDEVAFVVQTPDTGETGVVTLMQASINDYELVTVRGRVVTDAGSGQQTPIEGVIVSVSAETWLVDPTETRAKGGQVSVSGLAALNAGNNQFATSYTELPVMDDGLTATGCPISLALVETDADGRYEFSFSPRWTEFLSALFARDISSGSVQDSGLRRQDRFTVRISGTHLQPAYGINSKSPNGTPQFSGIRYDFLREPDTGIFKYREDLTGDFNLTLPQGTWTNVLDPYQGEAIERIQTQTRIVGLPDPVKGLGDYFYGLFTFPSLAGTPLGDQIADETVLLRMPWSEATDGVFDGDVVLEGVGVFPMQRGVGSGTSCSPSGVFYEAHIPGLAVKPGPFIGRIAGVAGGRLRERDVVITTEPGPTWFSEPGNPYESASINWSPGKIAILAREIEHENDQASATVELGVGSNEMLPIDNRNKEENILVTQNIVGGSVKLQERVKQTTTSVFGRTEQTQQTKLGLPGRGFVSYDYGLASRGDEQKACGASPFDCPGPTDYGSLQPQPLIPTVVTPLFRYAWGVPPIAAAVVGADFFLSVSLINFGFIDYGDAQILVNSVLEPSTVAGLDVFFDFSAIFGLVQAQMNAIPTIGVGMPVVLTDSEFDSTLSGPCFQFLLDLILSVKVGVCPLCIEGSFSDRPIEAAKPKNCTIFSLAQKGGLSSAPPSGDALSLSNNQQGMTLAARSESDGIYVQRVNGFSLGVDYLLDSGPGAMQPAVAFYAANRALAVWAQSSLDPVAFQQLVDADNDCTLDDLTTDPGCDDFSQWNASQYQHLVYALWDGTNWSPAQNLTMPTTGEGGVVLAACMDGEPGCPQGGEVYAVWHRDMAGDIRQHQIKLFEAVFDGNQWSTPTPVDNSNGDKQVQPAAVYRNGEPVLVFVRNSDPLNLDQSLNLENRQLAFRIGAGSIQTPPELTTSVASPSAVVASDGTIAIAYTRSAPGDPFIGSRRALNLATLGECSSNSCGQVLSSTRRDQYGRQIYVEKPQLTIDAQDNLLVTYRWLSPGDQLFPGDPFGPQGYGNIATQQLAFSDVNEAHQNIPLTTDGAVNWQVGAVFDPSLNALVVIAEQGGVAAGRKLKQSDGVHRLKIGSSTRPVSLLFKPVLPDLSVESASSDANDIVQPGQELTLQVQLSNRGTPLERNRVFSAGAWWNGPPGVGEQLDLATRLNLPANGTRTLELAVTIPEETPIDVPQTLYVVVDHEGQIDESDNSNNVQTLSFNTLAAPQDILPYVDLAGEMALLEWSPMEDTRVTGFQVYRRDLSGENEMMIGMTPVNGFADLLSVPGAAYEYCVRSLSLSGQLSHCSDWIALSVEAAAGDALFSDGFEAPIVPTFGKRP